MDEQGYLEPGQGDPRQPSTGAKLPPIIQVKFLKLATFVIPSFTMAIVNQKRRSRYGY
jgi:hypothetical protein